MGSGEKNKPASENAPIMLSNLDSNLLESYGEPGPDKKAEVQFS